MTYKLIFCDLDETLLDKNREIPTKNIEAIKKAKEEYNVKFVCATGRHYSIVQNILKELDLYDKENEYVCSLNGALLTENKGNNIIRLSFLSYKDACKIISFALNHDLCIELYTLDHTYIYNLNDDERKRVHHVGLDFIEIIDGSHEFLENQKILKIALQSCDFKYLQTLGGPLQNLLENVVTSYSSNRYIECFSKDTSKGIALEWLANQLNVDIKDTIAIGDHFNDVAMLEAAGLSVAANNAQEGVKQLCDYVTNANNNEGVVCEVLEKFVFKEEL